MAASMRTAIDEARASVVPSSATMPRLGVVLALARIEAKQMLRHPAFLLATGLGLLLTRGAVGLGLQGDLMTNLAWFFGGLALGALIGGVLTANVAALRARRDHLLELFGALPSPAEARTAGVLAGLVIGLGGLATVVAGIAWILFEQVNDAARETDLFLAVQYPLALVALGALGVAVARWIPSVLGGPLVVIGHVFTGLIWIVPWIMPASSGISVAWHLTYLAAVILGFAMLAFARDLRTVARFASAVALLGLAVVAAVQQTPLGGY